MNSSDVGLQRNYNGKSPGGITGKGFRPGQSGNPSGKRKGSVSLAAALASSLTKKDAKLISRKLISLGKSGDVPALKLLFDRLDDVEMEERITALEQQLLSRTHAARRRVSRLSRLSQGVKEFCNPRR